MRSYSSNKPTDVQLVPFGGENELIFDHNEQPIGENISVEVDQPIDDEVDRQYQIRQIELNIKDIIKKNINDDSDQDIPVGST